LPAPPLVESLAPDPLLVLENLQCLWIAEHEPHRDTEEIHRRDGPVTVPQSLVDDCRTGVEVPVEQWLHKQ
jgi:hypothetical protein